MSRTLGALLAVLAMLVLCGASASATAPSGPAWGVVVDPGKNHIVFVRYSITGDGVKEARLYLMPTTSKYLVLTSGTSKFLKLANGVKYWLRYNPPHNASSNSMITLAMKAKRGIPSRKPACIYVKLTGFTPAVGDIPAYRSTLVDKRGFCMSGRKWLDFLGS